ncbi:MAG: RNA polymerase sigma factor [Deltaproteobacteria bacterium]|nr:RNA polymerase sigma factor [Deltaproteobacteria bacterium]
MSKIETVPLHSDQSAAPTRVTDTVSEITGWVQSAKRGSRHACNRLVEQFQEKIFRMVFYRIRSRSDAEDLTQEIFLQAFKSLPRLKNEERFKSWLFSIAINRIRDYYRKKKLRSFFMTSIESEENVGRAPRQEDDGGTGALQRVMRKDFWKQVGILLDKMPRMEREVFTLRFMDQLSIREVSQALKKNESTVKTHLYRGIQKFRKEASMRNFLKEVIS